MWHVNMFTVVNVLWTSLVLSQATHTPGRRMSCVFCTGHIRCSLLLLVWRLQHCLVSLT